MAIKIETPCIGVCSTIYGDDICRGCHRTFDEIIKWNEFSINKRKIVHDRLQSLQAKYLSNFFEIYDFELFQSLLSKNSIMIERSVDLFDQNNKLEFQLSFVYKILKKHNNKFNILNNKLDKNLKSNQIRLSNFGIILKNTDNKLNLNQIMTEIDEAIYKESENIFSRV